MGLRSDWSAFKSKAELDFQKMHKAELTNAHMAQPTPYPLKFNQDLGPALDNFEKAKKANNAADKAKYQKQAKDILGKYEAEIDKNLKILGPQVSGSLESGLAHLKAELAK